MIEPFRIPLSAETIDDLRSRLHRTRWPEPSTTAGWDQGTPLAYAQELCRYWSDDYDWFAADARLNRHPQFRARIDGLAIHFVHVRSPRPDAVPLLMTHGWPGSIVEFAEVVDPLVAAGFHVVCPSLPGYGFSDKPSSPGWSVHRTADAWAELMGLLGYARFLAQGHDWGTSISTSLAQRHPSRVLGIHLMPPLVAPLPDQTPAERDAAEALSDSSGDGYSFLHSTRPQTIGYGLVDSPAALSTWVLEKFHAWTDPSSVLSHDQLIDNLMMYWLPATGASSARMYWESFAEISALFHKGSTDTVPVPTGCSVFPYEVPHPSRRWAERRFPDIRYWSEPPRGGHFAAFEVPALFVEEVQACADALLDR
jgi:pimeloyl-ACP methyl ester carboxylesterase